MKYIVLVIFLALVACTKETEVDTNTSQPALASKVELSFNTEITFQEGVKIKVTKVEDSRCPQNTTCIWAGKASVFFTITDKGVSKDSSIDFESKPIKSTIDVNGIKYEVEIADVLPYPKNATEINQKDYKVSLTVKKL